VSRGQIEWTVLVLGVYTYQLVGHAFYRVYERRHASGGWSDKEKRDEYIGMSVFWPLTTAYYLLVRAPRAIVLAIDRALERPREPGEDA